MRVTCLTILFILGSLLCPAVALGQEKDPNEAKGQPAATSESTSGQSTTPEATTEGTTDEEKEAQARAEFEKSIRFRNGDIELDFGGASLAVARLGERFRYIGPSEAAKLLEAWGNPPDAKTLGMILPAEGSVFDPELWAIVITYEEDGYVSDDDAANLDYGELLTQMQEQTKEANKARKEAGYQTLEIVGWAEPPRYDAQAKKLHWAKELKFEGQDEHTLNYNIRVLGRHGVLVLNAVAGMTQLGSIRKAVPNVLEVVEFVDGKRYKDFDSSVDKVAAYGIGGLIAGKVAMKVGLFKGLWLAILAGKKFFIIGAIAVGAFVFRLFGRKKRAGHARDAR